MGYSVLAFLSDLINRVEKPDTLAQMLPAIKSGKYAIMASTLIADLLPTSIR